MITIKLPYNTSDSNKDYILMMIRQQNSAIKYLFNRIQDHQKNQEKLTQVQLTEYTYKINNVDLLDTWFLQSAVYKAQAINESFITKLKETEEYNSAHPGTKRKFPTLIFGGKGLFYKRSEKKIKKSEWNLEKLIPLYSIGEANNLGNRKFRLKVLENNSVIFQPDLHTKIELVLPKLRKNYKKDLYKLQELSEDKKIPITFELDLNNIYIIYDEIYLKEPEYSPVLNRQMAIDLNPNYIGYSVIDWKAETDFNIIKTGMISIKEINDRQKKVHESSDDSKNIYWNNKREYEIFQISKELVNLAKYFKVEKFGFEGLSIKSSDKNKGSAYNRLVNNLWNRDVFIKNLIKRLNISGIKPKDVPAAYSSFVGNFLNGNYPDPVAASIEINRRLYICYSKSKNSIIFPSFKVCKSALIKSLEEIDKRLLELLQDSKDWKDFYKRVKNSKLRYRVPLEKFKFKVLSLFHGKSLISESFAKISFESSDLSCIFT